MGGAVKVVSWNVLADAYVRPEYYPYTDRAHHLKWQSADTAPLERRERVDFLLCSAAQKATPVPLPPITDVTPLPSADEPSDHLRIAVLIE